MALLTNLLHDSALAPGDDICTALRWVGECLGNLTFTADVLIDNKHGCCFTKLFASRGRGRGRGWVRRYIACDVISIGVFLAIASNKVTACGVTVLVAVIVFLVANIFMRKFCQHLYIIGNRSTESRHVGASARGGQQHDHRLEKKELQDLCCGW